MSLRPRSRLRRDHVTTLQAAPPIPPASAGPYSSLVSIGVLPLLCPSCGGQMRILGFLTDPPVVSRILLHLELHHLPPPLSPARGPPQGDFLLDQTSGFDPAEAEPVPDFVFDQSVAEEFED